jgi:ATP-dependent DNA ligase
MAAKSITIKDYHTQIPGGIDTDGVTWKFPDVLTRNALGATLMWSIIVRVVPTEDRDPKSFGVDDWMPLEQSWLDNNPLGDELMAWICVQSGQINPSTGLPKIRDAVPTIVKTGKNIGKKNATNVFCQALRDALSSYNTQLRKAHSDDNNLLPPMLAQDVKDQKNLTIIPAIPAYVQPKFNGIRAVSTLIDGRWVMYSRRKLEYPGFEYIRDELNKISREQLNVTIDDTTYTVTHLDGEVYSHGVELQTISGVSRRLHVEGDPDLQYYVYDCIVSDSSVIYSVRKQILDKLFDSVLKLFPHIHEVPTQIITSLEDAEPIYKSYLKDLYEGAMIRLDHKYDISYNEHHSKSLLKYKPTFDAEYSIIGFEQATKGKAAGALMMICETADHKSFNVTPALEIIERLSMYKKMNVIEPNGKNHFSNHWLGRPLIVYYDELSNDSVPQRARTKMEIRTWD